MTFTSPVRIESERLSIRPVEKRDLPDLMAVNGDDAATRYLPYASWCTAADAGAWLERMRKIEATGTAMQLVVVDKALARPVGTCLLFRFEAASGRAELGYVLGRAHWGTGMMFEALTALITHAFTVQGLRRLEAEVNPDNLASCRLLTRLGFTTEGLLRQRWVAKGVTCDSQFFGLLRADWPVAR
ncbi:GNAT family N-acetyltransferase [soil metagenome]